MKTNLPTNAQRINRVRDLPDTRSPAVYLVANGDEKPARKQLTKRQRQVTEALMDGPIYCASFIRLSDTVLILRERGIDIETEMFRGNPGTDTFKFGVYRLRSKIQRASEVTA